MFLVLAGDAAAQTSVKPKPRTTKSGVYSREQADRGQDVYIGMCKSCHTPESHTAATFTVKWNGKPLSALYEYIRDQMPKNEPGSLSEQEYADVLAYVLKLNRMPAGSDDLPTEVGTMKTIRFETTTPTTTKSPVRKSP
jgi:mono/diheme cytochrome c family protein